MSGVADAIQRQNDARRRLRPLTAERIDALVRGAARQKDPQRAMHRGFAAIVRGLSPVAVATAAEYCDALGFDVTLPGVDVDRQAHSAVGYAIHTHTDRETGKISTQKLTGALTLAADRLISQTGRDVVLHGTTADRYARVPVGDTCAFCLMLGSRGFVYHTQATAGKFTKFHGDCNCEIVPARKDDIPDIPGYDPGGLYDAYLIARDNATNTSPQAILAEMREMNLGR